MCTGNKATQICGYRYLTCLMSHDYTFYVVDAQIRIVLHHKRDYIHCAFNEITSGQGETIIITYIWGPTCNIENLQKKRHFQNNTKLDMCLRHSLSLLWNKAIPRMPRVEGCLQQLLTKEQLEQVRRLENYGIWPVTRKFVSFLILFRGHYKPKIGLWGHHIQVFCCSIYTMGPV